MAFAGLVLFVAFPLAATGSVGGAIFSRILGMGRALAFSALALGSMLGCGVMYFGSHFVSRYIDRDDPSVRLLGIVVVALIIVAMNYWYNRIKKNHGGGEDIQEFGD